MPTIREKERIVRQNLTKANRENVYEVERFLDLKTRQRTSLRVRCPVYPQDPAVAAADDQLGIQEIDVRWEPSMGDGPTSARVAVVDYNGDTGVLVPSAEWDADKHRFLDADGNPITVDSAGSRQFDQVNAWAIVESVLEYFENPRGLGRPIPWGFDGNRLIVVPHAGYDENAYYDRRTKSLQLYYFGDPEDPKYTCLSHDIVAHEAGHAVLDGIRPHYNLNSSVQTAAFHEFMGDLTAILLALRNNHVRSVVWKAVASDLSKDKIIANLAEEFGRTVNDSREDAYLRTAHNDRTLEDVAGLAEPHAVSEVLTGAMFELLTAMAETYSKGKEEDEKSATPAQALWRAIDRFGRVAIQPLDLCPPMDIQFVDYARAVVRNFELVDPVDERGLRQAALKIFHQRGLCPYGAADHDDDACALLTRGFSYLRPTIYHDVDRIAASRTHAYHFLHDNRKAFRIPAHQDFVVADLYRTHKMGSAARRLPTEVVVEYVWRQPVVLKGARFQQFEGQTAPLLCGGTLVLDGRGNIRSWFRKPGTEHPKDAAEGIARRDALLDHLAGQIAAGRVALAADVEGFGVQAPPVVARIVDGLLSLESSPHFRESEGAEPWNLSF